MSDFYRKLTPFYHLLYPDWEASIADLGRMLDEIIRARWGPDAKRLLDVSCGIGTQSLGLAPLGYRVTASDLSPDAVGRARAEAAARGLDISFSVADMRAAHTHHGGGFDVLITAGNSLPHLLDDAEIGRALGQFYACLRPGGGLIVTMRQYDQEARGRGLFHPFRVHEEGGQRTTVFQIWDFEGDQYDLTMYFVVEERATGAAETHVMRSRYYAISPDHLSSLIKAAGFVDVQRLDDDKTNAAILAGTRPAGAGQVA